MLSVGKIPDELGHLILTEDGAVAASGGELQNNEQFASVIMNLITSSKSQLWPSNSGEPFKRITITYSDHCYVICLSNKKIYIVKRKLSINEPVKV